jgi:outer membrane protein
MKVRVAVFAAGVLLLFPAAQAWAQAGGAAAQQPAAQTPGKVGVLSVRQAIVSTAEGKLASAELQSQFAPRQTELENFRKQIDDLQTRLRAGERTLSDEEKGRLTRQGEALSRQLQRKQEDYQEDANEAQNVIFERIGAKLMEVVDRYSRENGYSLILDVSAQTTPVLYAAPAINVTQDIIRLYDQAHPVRPASAPAQPPAKQPGKVPPPQR